MIYTKLTLKIKSKPPYFIGSQIRGALGVSLKKVVCINPSFRCEGCFSTQSCLYFELYEKQNSFHKYRLDFELGKELYDVNIYLFEEVAHKFIYVVSALEKMVTKTGLGEARATFKNFELYLNDQAIFKNGEIMIDNIETIRHFKKDDKWYKNVTIEFITPLRIKKRNRFVRDTDFELEDILRSIQKRLEYLQNKNLPTKPFQGTITKKHIKYKELTRKSNRQKTVMSFGGIVGKVDINGLNEHSYRLLEIAELIGVGKQTVFGLGKIKMEKKDE